MTPSFNKVNCIALAKDVKMDIISVYGGSKMADGSSCTLFLENGEQALAYAAIPQRQWEIARGIDFTTIVETMAERKTAMLEQGDLFYRPLQGGLEHWKKEAIQLLVGKLGQTLCFLQLL